MIKKGLVSALLGLVLVFSSCGSSDNEGESRLATQQMLDDGDYNGVIEKLEPTATTDEEYLALASAYMGKAGYSLLEIISALTSDDNIVSSLASSSSFSSTLDLNKAVENFKNVVGQACQENNETLSGSQRDICLYIGLSEVSKIASTVLLLVGDIGNFGSDTNNTEDYKLTATTCALQYAFENNVTSTTVDFGDCNISRETEVTFTLIARTYTPIKVIVKSEDYNTTYHYLMTEEDNATTTRSTVLTSGYCSNESFTPRLDDYNSSYSPTLYACPINESKDVNETTSMNVLVDALNGGLDSVTAAIPANEQDSDVQNSIDEFKCEVLGGTYDTNENNCTVDVKQDVNETQVIDYLSTQNGGN